VHIPCFPEPVCQWYAGPDAACSRLLQFAQQAFLLAGYSQCHIETLLLASRCSGDMYLSAGGLDSRTGQELLPKRQPCRERLARPFPACCQPLKP
jgi:hypothetical protein